TCRSRGCSRQPERSAVVAAAGEFFRKPARGACRAGRRFVMSRPVLVIAVIVLAPGCVDISDAPAVGALDQSLDSNGALQDTREHVAADIFHYAITFRVGNTPNARLRIHRIVRELAPWRPRPTANAAMLLHGDFATFVTNFAPSLGDASSPVGGLAPHLAAH